jgi:hypothetical protein
LPHVCSKHLLYSLLSNWKSKKYGSDRTFKRLESSSVFRWPWRIG